MASGNHESLATRLYRGDVSFDFIGKRRRWYIASGIVVLVSIISLAVRGLTPTIDFKGGTEFSVPAANTTISQVQSVIAPLGLKDTVVTTVGSGGAERVQVQTGIINQTGASSEANRIADTLARGLHISTNAVSFEGFSGSWGSQITDKAILGLIIFLVFVLIYLSIRFEWKMAIAAMIALLHDLVVTAGIYSLVGFEVSPSTVIALLTILGYSLYDTVVVFDKVRENIAGIDKQNAMTFSEATNLAVNQTLVRSINTSVIALLPVIGLLVIGAGLLGAGSLDDLALALLIGLASGAYSSIFIASPLVAELKEREPRYQNLTKRVLSRRTRDTATERSPAAAAVTPAGAAGTAPRQPRQSRPDRGAPRRRHGGGGRPRRKRR